MAVVLSVTPAPAALCHVLWLCHIRFAQVWIHCSDRASVLACFPAVPTLSAVTRLLEGMLQHSIAVWTFSVAASHRTRTRVLCVFLSEASAVNSTSGLTCFVIFENHLLFERSWLLCMVSDPMMNLGPQFGSEFPPAWCMCRSRLREQRICFDLTGHHLVFEIEE